MQERVLLTPESTDADEPDEDSDVLLASKERPMVMDRNHSSWAEVDAESRNVLKTQ